MSLSEEEDKVERVRKRVEKEGILGVGWVGFGMEREVSKLVIVVKL